MAIGDIAAGFLDTYQFCVDNFEANYMCEVVPGIYVVAYTQNPARPTVLGTIAVSPLGDITNAIISTVALPGAANEPTIAKIAPNVFAVLRATGAGGGSWRIDTIGIADDGTIGAIIATRETATGFGQPWIRQNPLQHVAGDIWCWVEQDTGVPFTSTVRTITISAMGVIGGAPISTQNFAYNANQINTLQHITGNVWAIIASANAAVNTLVRTFTISDAGVISAEINQLPLDASPGLYAKPVLFNIRDNVWGTVYCTGASGRLRTLTINDDGTIGALIDMFDFSPQQIWGSVPVNRVGSNVFTIFYTQRAGGAQGENIISLIINDNGTIGAVLSTSAAPRIQRLVIDSNIYRGTHYYITLSETAGLPPTMASLNTYQVETVVAAIVVTQPPTGNIVYPTMNGQLTYDGGESCDCGFEWGPNIAYGNTTATQSKTTGQTFAVTLSGLALNETYHYRAFARNNAGTSYGADMTFSTDQRNLAYALSRAVM